MAIPYHVAHVPDRKQVSGAAARDHVRYQTGVCTSEEESVGILGGRQFLHMGTEQVRMTAVVVIHTREHAAQRSRKLRDHA